MTQTKRLSARTVILAAGVAGFVALGAGVAGAEGLQTPVHDLSPAVERVLVEGVAPTMNTIAPEGVGPIAGTALEELQSSAHNPERGAPDLGAVLPESPLAETVTEVQDATGLDGDPHDTIGHSAGEAVEAAAQDAGVALEEGAHKAGAGLEDSASEVLPHTVESVVELRDEVLVLPDLEEQRLPELSEVTELTGGNTLKLEELDSPAPVAGQGDTLPMSHPTSAPPTPGLTDLTEAVLAGEVQPIDLNGPLADAQLPQLAEGVDTTTAEDLVAGLSRGPDLLNDLDTSDLVSIEGGTVEQETPEGMVEHPTFMDLPGSEALPVIS
ncbi:hypothetical protein [Nocardiopsis alkaliphila]|uniref:hypothetical protein n=1 Tax=Nocardiopsis alkaliphila TaxID=225762 RepID=UPI000344B2E1|nr:hypothetical protein [Nocardiopsis alkaliphila]